MELYCEEKKYDYLCNILILGNEFVGKSAFIEKYKNKNNYKKFLESQKKYFPTIGCDVMLMKIKYLNKKFKLQVWDTSGQETFFNIIKAYLKTPNVILIFYDALNRISFNKAKTYYQEYISVNADVMAIFIRSKYELKGKNILDIVSDEEVLEFIDNKPNSFFFHLSCFEKYETGINNLIEFIIIQIIKNKLNL